MKGALTTLAAIGLLFAACSKSSSPSTSATTTTPTDTGYYMRFKADGVQKEYKTTWAKMEMGDDPPYHTAYFTGGDTAAANAGSFSFRVYSTDSVSAGITYSQAILSGSTTPMAYCNWVDQSGAKYLSFKTTADSIYDFSAIITEKTSTTVKGTFSGMAKNINSSQVVSITDGEFYLNRLN